MEKSNVKRIMNKKERKAEFNLLSRDIPENPQKKRRVQEDLAAFEEKKKERKDTLVGFLFLGLFFAFCGRRGWHLHLCNCPARLKNSDEWEYNPW